MVKIRGFKAYIANPDYLEDLVIETEDVIFSKSNLETIKNKNFSFLRINNPEIEYAEQHCKVPNRSTILEKARENLQNFIAKGVYTQIREKKIYIYRQVTAFRSQTGILCSIDHQEYLDKKILPHEKTLNHKVQRLEEGAHHLGIYNSFPMTFTDFDDELSELMMSVVENDPFHRIVKKDVTHLLYETTSAQTLRIIQLMKSIPKIYIADGHHRFETYSKVANQLKSLQASKKLEEDFDYFSILVFPKHSLKVYKFNRLIKTQNGKDALEILRLSRQFFKIRAIELQSEDKNEAPNNLRLKDLVRPKKPNHFTLYFAELKKWFEFVPNTRSSTSFVENLGISYFTTKFIRNIMGIDPVKDQHLIKYLPALKSVPEKLQKELEQTGKGVAVLCHEVSIEDIEGVADERETMPAKSSFVYPKPLIGMIFKAFEVIES